MSGRGLRKLPLKAHAFYLEGQLNGNDASLEAFLRAMLATLADGALVQADVHV
jgi:hypothetical protein